jgi:hypothetical protein
MLLIVCLGIIAKVALVAGDCDFGNITLKNFDVKKVGINVLTCLLYTAAVQRVSWFYMSLVVPLTNYQQCISD